MARTAVVAVFGALLFGCGSGGGDDELEATLAVSSDEPFDVVLDVDGEATTGRPSRCSSGQ